MELSAHHSQTICSSRMRLPALRGGVPMRRKAPQIRLCVLAWVAALSLSVVADDLEQIKASILSDCDLLDSRLSSVRSDSQSIISDTSVGVAYSRQLYAWPDDVSSLNDRQKEYIKGMADKWQEIDSDISTRATNVVLLVDSLSSVVSSIRASANSITASSDGSCNCDLTPVITAINDFKSQQFDDWHNFFIDFADVPEDVHFLKSNIETIKYTVEYIDDSILDIKTFLTNQLPIMRNSLESINSSLVSIDSKFDNFTNFNSSVEIDLSSITNRLDTIISIESSINGKFDSLFTGLSNIQTSLDYNNFLLEHGFSSVTDSINNLVSVTNRIPFSYRSGYTSYLSMNYRYINNSGASGQVQGRYFYSDSSRGYNVVEGVSTLNAYLLPAVYYINNELYDFSFRRFPILTNTVGTLTTSSTNFFSFFRGEIRPRHSLADWTSNDGSIYDYLTNQYILSRSSGQSNWFGRVENLLAALVFESSATAKEREKEQEELTSSLDDVKDSQSELESLLDFDKIDFVNLDSLSHPSLPDFDSRLPEVLVINLGSFGWLDDGADFTIDIHPDDVRSLIEIVRGFFRLIWWGVVLGLVYLLFNWFVRLLRWVWSALKGVDF